MNTIIQSLSFESFLFFMSIIVVGLIINAIVYRKKMNTRLRVIYAIVIFLVFPTLVLKYNSSKQELIPWVLRLAFYTLLIGIVLLITVSFYAAMKRFKEEKLYKERAELMQKLVMILVLTLLGVGFCVLMSIIKS